MSLLAFHQSKPTCRSWVRKQDMLQELIQKEKDRYTSVHVLSPSSNFFQPHWINHLFSVHLIFLPAGEVPNTLWVINAYIIEIAMWYKGMLTLRNCYTASILQQNNCADSSKFNDLSVPFTWSLLKEVARSHMPILQQILVAV